MPAAGYRGSVYLYGAGSWGYYLSSSLCTVCSYCAYGLFFNSGNVYLSNSARCYGFSVRPVRDSAPVEHEYVDLGLPSGTKWATCNIGATNPEEYGDYFAWGETEPYYTEGHSQDSPCENWNAGKSGYNWSNYKWCNGSYDTMTKYCTDSGYGTVDGKTVLESADDAATVNWGSGWKMPTQAQFVELVNSSYTSTTWTTQNGVYGRKITSKSNGNSIFLPAAGYRDDGFLFGVGSYGRYWSSSLYTNYSSSAYYLYFNSGYVYPYNYHIRYYGLSVRPVR